MSIFNAPQFQDPDKAREYLERQVWPHGPVCPHCSVIGGHWKIEGKSTRPGLYKCKDCLQPFTVTVGSLFERSKVGLHLWLQAVHMVCSSKKGVSAHQVHRTLGVTYKTAWFMCHRIREAMAHDGGGLLGGGGKIVEADETYWGTSPRSAAAKKINKSGRMVNIADKQKIVALVERDGSVRSFHVASVTGRTLKAVLHGNISPEANLMTDDARIYRRIAKQFASHASVNHSAGEYARGNAHTNTVEGYFSILKRGLVGTFHHVSPKHLGRYVSEFDFRYNTRTAMGYTDSERADMALKRITGKRLTYRRTKESQASA